MKISKKLQQWVEQGFISDEQAQQILQSEQRNYSGLVWRWLYGIAGLFIGLGIILIIGSNWDDIPALVKLIADFGIWGGFIYSAYWSIINKKDKIKEFFLLMSFLFVGTTIGLVAQIFNLSGGWHSFAMSWALLGLPFVWFSRLLFFNCCWMILFLTSFNYGFVERMLDYANSHLDGLVLFVATLSLVGFASKKSDKAFNKYTLLPKALRILSMFSIYVMIFLSSFGRHSWYILGTGCEYFVFIALISFAFFGIRLFLAFKNQNMVSFKRNALVVEFYIFFIFTSRMTDLLLSGFGFVFSGLLILGFIYVLRKTTKYIKAMEVFHE